MSTAQSKAIQNHRRRLKARGLVRLEVQIAETDTVLIRRLAKVLREDPEQAAVLRRQLQATLDFGDTKGLKALLVSAPLEGIEITRVTDSGRAIDL